MKKVESFKFLGVHITDKLKWSTHTDSVVKKVQQRLFNLRRLKKFVLAPKTLTNFYRSTIESILSGCCLVRQLHRPQPQGSPEGGVVYPMHHRGQTTYPPGHLQHPMSQEGPKDQGQQPPKPLPVHLAIIKKARSVQVHQSWDRETEKQLLSQGHQTVK